MFFIYLSKCADVYSSFFGLFIFIDHLLLAFEFAGAALPWSGIKVAHHLPPVCPQKLPLVALHGNTAATNARMSKGRHKYWTRLWPYLRNESEDCLYLNVYVPAEEHELTATLFQRKHLFPVIVYVHGESFEWNAGNAYDGSVLSSYSEVIVVTVNYRLGILGKNTKFS